MLRRCLPRLRLLLFALLALATLARPMLIAACDIHAVAHAHASQPHTHAGEGDEAGADEDGHGVHETVQQGSLAAMTDALLPLEVPALAFDEVALPEARPTPLPAQYDGAPFRPPIA